MGGARAPRLVCGFLGRPDAEPSFVHLARAYPTRTVRWVETKDDMAHECCQGELEVTEAVRAAFAQSQWGIKGRGAAASPSGSAGRVSLGFARAAGLAFQPRHSILSVRQKLNRTLKLRYLALTVAAPLFAGALVLAATAPLVGAGEAPRGSTFLAYSVGARGQPKVAATPLPKAARRR